MRNPMTPKTAQAIYTMLDECAERLRKISELHPALAGLGDNDESIESIRENVALLAARTAGEASITLPEPSNGEIETYALTHRQAEWADRLIA